MLTLLPLALSLVGTADATEIGSSRFVGVGVVLGDPTGLSGNFFLGGPANSIDLAVAYGTIGRNSGWLYVHADYLFHPPPTIYEDDVVDIGWHVGVGGFIKPVNVNNDNAENDFDFGVRVPIGMDFDFQDVPIGLFADVALLVGLIPRTYVGANFSIGARFYF